MSGDASTIPVFAPMKNVNLLKAARGEKPDRVPVWLMRQAGRHLPEFREAREKNDFLSICRDPKLATEVTLQPLARYDLDAAIIFSDILTIPDAMGMELSMVKGKGPTFETPLDLNEHGLDTDVTSVCEKLGYVYAAITECRLQLNGRVPLIGFSGCPFTLLGYMMEGGGSKTYSKTRAAFYNNFEKFENMIMILSDLIIEYLNRQIQAGAQLVQLFESNAVYISPPMVACFSKSIKKIANKVKERNPDIPITVFAKDANKSLIDGLKDTKSIDVFSVDWSRTGEEAREAYGDKFTLQGNLDPATLYASEDVIKDATSAMINSFGSTKYIANIGHGVYPDIPITGVKAFVDAVHAHPI